MMISFGWKTCGYRSAACWGIFVVQLFMVIGFLILYLFSSWCELVRSVWRQPERWRQSISDKYWLMRLVRPILELNEPYAPKMRGLSLSNRIDFRITNTRAIVCRHSRLLSANVSGLFDAPDYLYARVCVSSCARDRVGCGWEESRRNHLIRPALATDCIWNKIVFNEYGLDASGGITIFTRANSCDSLWDKQLQASTYWYFIFLADKNWNP